MQIFGIGIDIVETERVEQSISKFESHFINRIFTEREQQYCSSMANPITHYAVRFAAKEAVSKAFGTGLGEISFLDIEVIRDGVGKPSVVLYGNGKKFTETNGITQIMISLSHSDAYAAANAVAVCG